VAAVEEKICDRLEKLIRMVRKAQIAFYLLLLTSYFLPSAYAQHPGAAVAADSLHLVKDNTDSLLKTDSINLAMTMEAQRKMETSKQVATQRELDLTNDGKPEILRLAGKIAPNIDDTKLTFTIKSGKKLLYQDTWTAAGYFDTIDHLTDSVKRYRLRRLVTVFLANENFVVIDSADFADLFNRVSVADIKPGSAEASELFKEARVMFSVYHSRDFWYGLIWDPKKKKFVKAWRN
jgi:hypothetical protein